MPELPEVETVVRVIRPSLIGRKILRCRFFIPRQLKPQTPRQLSSRLNNRQIKSVERRGKFILMKLDHGILVIHLRMTGRLYVREQEPEPREYERAVIHLDNHTELVFRDPRTLGTIRCYSKQQEIEPLTRLGWEPLDGIVSATELKEKLSRRTIAVKPLLLNQSVWAGIGNIYASEILWEARIHPQTRSNKLSTARLQRLSAAVPRILNRALGKGGTTIRDFMSPDGKSGAYQKEFRVYGREGESCTRCKTRITRIVQAQRSTYFCRVCQTKR